MTCERITLQDGTTAIVCSRGKRRATCGWCPKPHERLCDHATGKRGRTCSKRLCRDHAQSNGEHDICPDHAVRAPVEAKAETCANQQVATGPHRLRVFTSRIWLRDPDITRGNGGASARPFAPSKKILAPALEARSEAATLRGRGADQEAFRVETIAWAVYAPAYREEMRRSYREHRAAWDELLARPRVVLACYCALDARIAPVDLLAHGHCHRVLLASYLTACGATYYGEIALPKARAA